MYQPRMRFNLYACRSAGRRDGATAMRVIALSPFAHRKGIEAEPPTRSAVAGRLINPATTPSGQLPVSPSPALRLILFI